MALITLTSDFGLSDHYVAATKGAILKELPVVSLVDISHEIGRDDIAHAAFVLKLAIQKFPEGTIHIVSVKPEKDETTPHILAQYASQYFIGADNGMFSLIFENPPQLVVGLDGSLDDSYTFPMGSTFVRAASHIARGGAPELLGKKLDGVQQMMRLEPQVSEHNIKGAIQHIDGYGNLITNIPNTLFERVSQRRDCIVSLRSAQHKIRKVRRPEERIQEGDLGCFYGGSGYLEIVIRSGSAAQLLGQHVTDSVLIQF